MPLRLHSLWWLKQLSVGIISKSVRRQCEAIGLKAEAELQVNIKEKWTSSVQQNERVVKQLTQSPELNPTKMLCWKWAAHLGKPAHVLQLKGLCMNEELKMWLYTLESSSCNEFPSSCCFSCKSRTQIHLQLHLQDVSVLFAWRRVSENKWMCHILPNITTWAKAKWTTNSTVWKWETPPSQF